MESRLRYRSGISYKNIKDSKEVQVYEKYMDYLLTLATALLTNVSDAEDVVHDVFVSFTQSPEKVNVNGNLKGYLSTSVVNRARDRIRTKQRQQTVDLEDAVPICADSDRPDLSAVHNEQMQQLNTCLAELPYQQREVIVLHLQGKMKFRQIAQLQEVSINTVQGRYRYGLDKLRSLLNCEVINENER